MIMLQKHLFCKAEEKKHAYRLFLYFCTYLLMNLQLKPHLHGCAFFFLFVFSQCAITCPLLWRNTAWWTWCQGQSTTSAWPQWREQERVLRLSALSTLCQRTWQVITSNVADLYKHTALERPKYLPFSPPSAAVDPGCDVCDVFNLNIVHLHVETVSDRFGNLRCARSSCIFQVSPLTMCPESNKRSFPLCRHPSFQISPIIRRQVRWEKNSCDFCLCWFLGLCYLHQSGEKRHTICV